MFPAAKSWFFALLLLAFVGQSTVALAMNCDLQHQDTSHSMLYTHHSAAEMHHEMDVNSPSANNHDSDETSDCCATMDHCISGGCSLPALNHELSMSPVFATSFAIAAYDREYLSVTISSLYRPPIFR